MEGNSQQSHSAGGRNASEECMWLRRFSSRTKSVGTSSTVIGIRTCEFYTAAVLMISS